MQSCMVTNMAVKLNIFKQKPNQSGIKPLTEKIVDVINRDIKPIPVRNVNQEKLGVCLDTIPISSFVNL